MDLLTGPDVIGSITQQDAPFTEQGDPTVAHFYGTLQGHRGMATRLGTKVSGLTVEAMSYEGTVETELYRCDGKDYARVVLRSHPDDGHRLRRLLYDGPVDPAKNAEGRHPSILDTRDKENP